jgi:hypothetical protein
MSAGVQLEGLWGSKVPFIWWHLPSQKSVLFLLPTDPNHLSLYHSLSLFVVWPPPNFGLQVVHQYSCYVSTWPLGFSWHPDSLIPWGFATSPSQGSKCPWSSAFLFQITLGATDKPEDWLLQSISVSTAQRAGPCGPLRAAENQHCQLRPTRRRSDL